jgi:hypothetical protein
VVFGVIAASHFEPGWGLQSEGHREEGWLSCSGPCDRRRRHHHRDERHRQRPGAAPVAEPAAEVQESAIVESDAPTSAQPAPTSTASQTTSVGSSSLQVTDSADSADSAQQANPTVTTESPAPAGRQAIANASSPASRIFAAEYTGAVSLEAGAVGFISPLFAVANFGGTGGHDPHQLHCQRQHHVYHSKSRGRCRLDMCQRRRNGDDRDPAP